MSLAWLTVLTLRSWYGAARCVVGLVVARLGITVDVNVKTRPVNRPLSVPRWSLGCIYSNLLRKEIEMMSDKENANESVVTVRGEISSIGQNPMLLPTWRRQRQQPYNEMISHRARAARVSQTRLYSQRRQTQRRYPPKHARVNLRQKTSNNFQTCVYHKAFLERGSMPVKVHNA